MAEENKSLDTQKKQKKEPNFFVRAGRRINKWFRELVSEGKKVVWPTWKQVVIVCILVVGIFVWALDIAFATIRDLLVSVL